MSFPNMTIQSQGCNTCGQTQTSCSCESVSQSTLAIQTLPRPVTPSDAESIPAEYYSTDQITWAGADNDVLGIKNGDTLTKVLNILMTAITA